MNSTLNKEFVPFICDKEPGQFVFTLFFEQSYNNYTLIVAVAFFENSNFSGKLFQIES